MLSEAGCDVVFCPESQEMYSEEPLLSLDFGELASEMEGKFRPGHFSGVGLVVSKLFNIVSPDRAYFGQKDLQQFFVIQRLVKDLSFDVELRCEPIIREESGLAMSSRNMRLSDQGKVNAAHIYKQLKSSELLIRQGVRIDQVKSKLEMTLKEQMVELEYLELVDANSMKVIHDHSSASTIALCIAAFVEGVRLIDNIIITLADQAKR